MPQLNATRQGLPSSSWLLSCVIPCAFFLGCELEPKPISSGKLVTPAVNMSRVSAEQLTSQHKERSSQPTSTPNALSHESQPALDALDAIPELPEPTPPSMDDDAGGELLDEKDPTSDWGC